MNTWIAAVFTASVVLVYPKRRDASSVLRSPSAGRVRGTPAPGAPEQECLEVLDSMVVLLEAGTPSVRALEMATENVRSTTGETASGWRGLHAAALADADVAEVWESLGAEWSCSAFEDVAMAWRMSFRHGCPLAQALAAAAQGIRATRRHRGAVEAAVAGARATMSVLLVLPILGCGLGLVLGVDLLSAYLGPSGLVTLWPGLALLLVGRRWAEGLVSRALRAPTAGSGSS